MTRRELATCAMALGAHALVVAWAWTPSRGMPVAPLEVVAVREAEVEIEAAEATPVEAAETVAVRVAPQRVVERAAPPAVATPAASTVPEALAGSNGTFIAFAPSTGIGGGGQINPFLARGALARDERDAGAPVGAGAAAANGKRSDGTLAAALRAQDVAKGLGPEGPVIRALEQATVSSAAPIKGGATFKAIVDAAGIVTDLRLVAWRGERAGWDDTRDVGARPMRVVHAHLESFKLL